MTAPLGRRLCAWVGLIGLSSAQQPAQRWPQEQWEKRDPVEEGFDAVLLREALEFAAGPERQRSQCVSVHRNGYLVAEGYWNGDDAASTNIVWSTAKAVTATMVGMAEMDGALTTESRAAEWIPEWRQ